MTPLLAGLCGLSHLPQLLKVPLHLNVLPSGLIEHVLSCSRLPPPSSLDVAAHQCQCPPPSSMYYMPSDRVPFPPFQVELPSPVSPESMMSTCSKIHFQGFPALVGSALSALVSAMTHLEMYLGVVDLEEGKYSIQMLHKRQEAQSTSIA